MIYVHQLSNNCCNASNNKVELCCFKVVGYTQPLIPMLWKTLLKLLNSNLFSAKAALLAAIARCEGDTWQPSGLVQGGQQDLQPYINTLVGQLSSSKQHRSVLIRHHRLDMYMPKRQPTWEKASDIAMHHAMAYVLC